jgi:hypothetical protein
LTYRVLTLRSIPVDLHDCNNKGECCNAEAERVELNSHEIRLMDLDKMFMVI